MDNKNYLTNLNELFQSPAHIKNYLAKNKIALKKRLGQNFLINLNIINKIILNSNLQNCAVLEIGAGLGSLTYHLAQKAIKIVAVELDGGLFSLLQQNFKNTNNVKFINADALKINLHKLFTNEFASFNSTIKICANLPYYLTSNFIANVLESKIPVSELILMVQKEAATRLCAKPSSRNCGAISYLIHYYCLPEILFNVSRNNFYPIPKVDSCVIKLKLKKSNQLPKITNEIDFFRLIKNVFSQRRKILITTLAQHAKCDKQLIKQVFSTLNLSFNLRPENLTLQQFATIYTKLQKLKLI